MTAVNTASGGPWARFVSAHLYDYSAAALRVWLAIVLAGIAVLVGSAWQVAQMDLAQCSAALMGASLVVLAAMFPVQIPRARFSFSVADVFVFYLLVTQGPVVAALAAGAEGLLGAVKTTRRYSSRLSTPAAALAGWTVAGWALEGWRAVLPAHLSAPLRDLIGLCGVGLIPFACTTLPLTAMVALKQEQRLRLSEWLAHCGWVGAASLASAMLAGLAHLNAVQFGPGALATSVIVVFGVILLMRVSVARQEAEHQAQEARIEQARQLAAVSQQRFTASFAHAGVGMAIVDPQGRMVQVNAALCGLLSRSEDQLLGLAFSHVLHPGDMPLLERKLGTGSSPHSGPFAMELRCVTPAASELWVTLYGSQFDDPGQAGCFRIYQLHDITSRREAERRLQHIAYHDSLTDLANRNCFGAALTVAVECSRLDPQVCFAVLFLDLDRFKVVNDSLGHLAGNELLREVAHRLRQCVRPSDLVARLGGDEFAMLLNAVASIQDGMRLAERVLEALSRPMSINGTEVIPGASIGITFSDLGYRTVDEVLRDADLAMYEAKGAGRGRVVLFDQSMHERMADKLALEADLRRAIGAGQLSVVFQPIFDLQPYRLSGFEALARWEHPERGPISPSVFIGLAEESGHIEGLTRWVIDHAAGQLAQWLRTLPGLDDIDLHVNISGRDLARPGLVEHVQRVLLKHALAPRHLTLEITETTLMGQLDLSLAHLHGLRAAGIRFSIDDFGTGYSSLAYLSTLPLDSLKIDRSFVLGMAAAPQNVEIVRAVLNLGLSLGKTVIAEGIETPEQLEALRALGVPKGQGYLFSRPLKAEQVPALVCSGQAWADQRPLPAG